MWYWYYLLTHRFVSIALWIIRLTLGIFCICFLRAQLHQLSTVRVQTQHAEKTSAKLPSRTVLQMAKQAGVTIREQGAAVYAHGSWKQLGFFVWLLVTAQVSVNAISGAVQSRCVHLKVTL